MSTKSIYMSFIVPQQNYLHINLIYSSSG